MSFKAVQIPSEIWDHATAPVRLGRDDQAVQDQVQKIVSGAHARWLAGSRARTWRAADARYGLQTTGEHLAETAARLRKAGRDLGLSVRVGKPVVDATAPVLLPVLVVTRAAPAAGPVQSADDGDQAGTALHVPGMVSLPDLTKDEYAALMDGLQVAVTRTQNAPRREALMALQDKLTRFAGKPDNRTLKPSR